MKRKRYRLQQCGLIPCVIMGEIDQISSENPFEGIKADIFDSKMIAELFVEPSDYSTIESIGNTIIEGSRGSGKTMVLRSLSFEGQLAELEARGKKTKDYAKPYIGVYIRLDPGPFVSLDRAEVSDKIRWKKILGHYFNMIIGQKIIETLLFAHASVGLELNDDGKYIGKIEKKAHFQTSNKTTVVESLQHLADEFDEAAQRVQDALNNLALDADFFDIYREEVTDTRTFIRFLCTVLCQNIPFIRDRIFYVLVDDYDHLSRGQQEVFNTFLTHTERPICYKVGSRKKGFLTFHDITGREMQIYDDANFVDLDYGLELDQLRTGKWYRHLRKVTKRRLEYCGYKEITIDDVLGHYYIEREIEERVLTKQERKRGLTGKDKIQDYLNNTSHKPYKEYKHTAGFQLIRKKSGIRKCYAGFRTLALLSSGIVRQFLVLSAESWKKAHSSDETFYKKNKIPLISFRHQSASAYRVSSRIYEGILNNEDIIQNVKEAERLSTNVQKLCEAIGRGCATLLYSPRMQLPESTIIVITNHRSLGIKMEQIIDAGIRGKIFHEHLEEGPRLDKKSQKIIKLNRILAPHFIISYRSRWRQTIPARILKAALPDQEAIAEHHRVTVHSRKQRKMSADQDDDIYEQEKLVAETTTSPRTTKVDAEQEEDLHQTSLIKEEYKQNGESNLPGDYQTRVMICANEDNNNKMLVKIKRIIESTEMFPILVPDWCKSDFDLQETRLSLMNECGYLIWHGLESTGDFDDMIKSRVFPVRVLIIVKRASQETQQQIVKIENKYRGVDVISYEVEQDVELIVREWLETMED